MIKDRNIAPDANISATKIRGLGGNYLGQDFFVFNTSSALYKDFVRTLPPGKVFSTLALGLAALTANRGDRLFVLPGYTETVTTAITVSKAGASIIGLGNGNARPQITGNGTIDIFNVTGNNVLIENLAFPAPETDDQTADINVSGAGVTIRGTSHIGSQTSKNKTDIITVASGADDLVIEGIRVYNTVVDAVSAISLEAAVARAIIRDCVIMGTFSTAAIMDEALATLALIERNALKNTKTTGAVVNFTNNSTGMLRFNHMSGRNTTLASNVVAGSGMDFFENRVTEEAALNGAVIPAADSD